MGKYLQAILIYAVFGFVLGTPALPPSPGSTSDLHEFDLAEFKALEESAKIITPANGCQCGRRNVGKGKIIGGEEAKPNEFPWRCFLRLPGGSPVCGCSIISEQWVVTAGHCVEALNDYDTTEVVVGAHDWTVDTEPGRESLTVSVSKDGLIHPSYRYRTGRLGSAPENDIALIRLPSSLTFNDKVSPVCLPLNFTNDDFSGSRVTASGWGLTDGISRRTTDTLQKVDLSVITNQNCGKYWGSDLISESMICTHEEAGLKGVCSGDSGSSIDLEHNGRYFAIGVTSFGFPYCLWAPSVFARVNYPELIEWIKSTTGESFCEG